MKKKGFLLAFGILCVSFIAGVAVFSNARGLFDKDRRIEIQFTLGQKYLDEMNYDAAILAYEKVIALDPKEIKAYVGLSHIYETMHQDEKAIEVLERGMVVVEEEKKERGIILDGFEELYKKEAEILLRLDRLQDAIAIIKRGILVNPTALLSDFLADLEKRMEDIKIQEESEKKDQELEQLQGSKEILNDLILEVQKKETDYDKIYQLLSDKKIADIDSAAGHKAFLYNGSGFTEELDGEGLLFRGGGADSAGLGWHIYYGEVKGGDPNGIGSAYGIDEKDGFGDLIFHKGRWVDGLPNGVGKTGFRRAYVPKGGDTSGKDIFDIKEADFAAGYCSGTVVDTSLSFEGVEEKWTFTSKNGKIVRDSNWEYDEYNNFEDADYYLWGANKKFVLLYNGINNNVCTRTVFLAD